MDAEKLYSQRAGGEAGARGEPACVHDDEPCLNVVWQCPSGEPPFSRGTEALDSTLLEVSGAANFLENGAKAIAQR